MNKRYTETGLHWFQRLNPKLINQSTGLEQLDGFMKHAFGPGYVFEIDGASGSGKTEFCFTLMAEAFKKREDNYYIYYIDYTNGFNPLRLKEILMNRFGPTTEEKVNDLLKRVISFTIRDPEVLLRQFLLQFVNVTKHRPVALLIIENIGLIIGKCSTSFPKFKEQGQFIRRTTISTIYSIARHFSIPVVLTNHIRGWRNELQPALGRIWATSIYHHIFITRNNREFIIQNFDSNMRPTSGVMKFYLTEKGITEY